MPVIDTLLTTEQVAKRLGVHQNTVIRFIQRGQLPAVKVGKSYKIKESVVAALLGEPVAQDKGARIIAVANHKGGVGKTTSAVNLAAALANAGKRVLLIDFDPQGGCAVCLGINTTTIQRTIYNALVDDQIDVLKTIMPTDFGFDLAPSNIDLAGAEVELRRVLAHESVLKRRLESILDRYDSILVDTPPNLGILTVNALTAADYVLIPVACEYMALRGLKMLLDTVRDVRDVTNPGLSILGILATRFDPRTLNSREALDYLKKLAERDRIKLFDQVIKHSVRVTEAPNFGKPLVHLHPDLEGAKAYQHVAEEVLHGQ